MAFDRFIRWDKERPTRAQLGTILVDFFGFAAKHVEWNEEGRRFYIVLHGTSSSPFKSVGGPNVFPTGDPLWEAVDRWIEVYLADGEPSSVITRRADDYTNVVATGFATALALFYDAKLEMG